MAKTKRAVRRKNSTPAKPRRGRNPMTGETIKTPARRRTRKKDYGAALRALAKLYRPL